MFGVVIGHPVDPTSGFVFLREPLKGEVYTRFQEKSQNPCLGLMFGRTLLVVWIGGLEVGVVGKPIFTQGPMLQGFIPKPSLQTTLF